MRPKVLDVLSRVNDSKQLSEQQRESLFEDNCEICHHGPKAPKVRLEELTDPKFKGRTSWSVAECSASEIDEGNILQAKHTDWVNLWVASGLFQCE